MSAKKFITFKTTLFIDQIKSINSILEISETSVINMEVLPLVSELCLIKLLTRLRCDTLSEVG